MEPGKIDALNLSLVVCVGRVGLVPMDVCWFCPMGAKDCWIGNWKNALGWNKLWIHSWVLWSKPGWFMRFQPSNILFLIYSQDACTWPQEQCDHHCGWDGLGQKSWIWFQLAIGSPPSHCRLCKPASHHHCFGTTQFTAYCSWSSPNKT